MSTKNSGRNSVPMTITGSIATKELMHHFSQQSDLTYRKMNGIVLSDANLYQSLLTGSLIRDCTFTKVIFSRSDLDGLRAERSVFVECDFTSCDIRSSLFTCCKFQACTFNSAFIDDCEFQFCEFTDSSFKVASLTHSRFQESSLHVCDLTQATFLHNRLYGTLISDMILGNCTLLYVILRNCTFMNVSISAESVGAIFGLTREQLSQAKLVYRGKEELTPPDSDILNLISEEYWQRKWYTGQLVLAVNFGLMSTINAFDIYLSLTFKRFAEFGFAKGEELEFLGDLLEELAFLDQLPLLTALTMLEWCTSLEAAIKQSNQGLPEQSGDSLRTLASRLALLTNTLLNKLDRSLPELESSESDRSCCIRATFQEKPAISLSELLNSIGAASNLHIAHSSYLVRIEKGSYMEIVFTTLSSVIAFQVFLFLLNGCIIQLTEMKHRLKALIRKDAPKTYKDMALSPVQQASPLILSVLRGLTEHAKGLGWLKAPSLSGYAASNIKSLQEVECGDSPSASGTSKI